MEYASRAQISYGYFLEQLNAGNIAEARINGLEVTCKFVTPPTLPAGKLKLKQVPAVSYGLFLAELNRDNVAEAHSDGREVVGRFKAPPLAGSAPVSNPSPTATAVVTGSAA